MELNEFASARLEHNELQQKIATLVEFAPVPGRHAARSAIRHVEKAWLLRHLDLEMAVFRAITAEEEAARAIIHALQRHRYPGASKLKWRRHDHKAAVAPFFDIVLRFISQIPGLETHLKWNRDDPRSQLELGIRFPFLPERSWMYPVPPLHFNLQANDKVHDFIPEIQSLASERNVTSIQEYVEQRANQRNQILYASDQGIPRIDRPITDYLLSRRDAIFRMLGVFVLIDPYREQQLFVHQTLDAFLGIVPRLRVKDETD